MGCPVNNCPGKEGSGDRARNKHKHVDDEHRLIKTERKRKGKKETERQERTDRKKKRKKSPRGRDSGGRNMTQQWYHLEGNVQYIMECQVQVYHRSYC